MYLFTKYSAYFYVQLSSPPTSLFAKGCNVRTLFMKDRNGKKIQIKKGEKKQEVKAKRERGGKIRAMFIICFRKDFFYD